jgi:hypothetical protein
MRNALFVVGVLFAAAGLLMAAGKMHYTKTDKVADFGKLEIEAKHEKSAPINWGYLLLGGGAILLVAGAMTRKQ